MSIKQSSKLLYTDYFDHHYILQLSDDSSILYEFTNEDLKQISSTSVTNITLKNISFTKESPFLLSILTVSRYNLKSLLILSKHDTSTNIHIIIGSLDTGIYFKLSLEFNYAIIKIINETGYILFLSRNILKLVFINNKNELIFNVFIVDNVDYYTIEIVDYNFPLLLKLVFKEKTKENPNKFIVKEHLYKITFLNDTNGFVNNNITKISYEDNKYLYKSNINKLKYETGYKIEKESKLNINITENEIKIGLVKYPNVFFARIKNKKLENFKYKEKETDLERKEIKENCMVDNEINGLKDELVKVINKMECIIEKYEKELKDKINFLNL